MSIPLPPFLCECSSIRKLSIVGDWDLHICGDVHWDQLKSLTIACSEDFINRVCSGAPHLEILELTICKGNENVSIRSSSLKKLSIEKKQRTYDYAMLTIWAPNLETLKIAGAAFNKCLLMDVSSLTDATLHFEDLRYTVVRETLKQILPTFQHVEKLALSSWCFEVLAVIKVYSFSPLSNVKLLTFDIYEVTKPNEIVGILEVFPKLNSLAIVSRCSTYVAEPLKYELNTIKSLMMQLRIVNIRYWGKLKKSIFKLIEFFLKHATMLEKIVIQKRGGENDDESDDMILASEKLLRLQRSFTSFSA